MGDGVDNATGLASGSRWRWSGREDSIKGRGCCLHLLNALDANLSKIYCFNFPTFSGVGGHGSFGGSEGGRLWRGQVQG